MFPSLYLRASDIKDQQPVVTIDRVAMEPVGQQREMKPVVYFQNKTKGLVLNKTNSKKISDIAGSGNTDDWQGVQIKLYSMEVEFQGEQVEAVRVRSPLASQRPNPPAPRAVPDSDDIPF
jgi:hypothetical protein